MVISCKKGFYEIIKNHKNAFDLAKFEECYIEECFDKYPYIVGDISDNILRLKGFSGDNRKDNYIGRVEDYIEESCAFRCPHYILKRINKDEYDKLLLENKPMPMDYDDTPKAMEKIPFDKDSLVLESTAKTKSKIIIDLARQNKITLGTIPDSLKESINKDSKENTVKEQKEVTYYSSSSEDFDPTKINNKFANKNNKNNNNNNNANNKNKDNKGNYRNNKNNRNNNNKKKTEGNIERSNKNGK
mgnify:CR=1 FL=1